MMKKGERKIEGGEGRKRLGCWRHVGRRWGWLRSGDDTSLTGVKICKGCSNEWGQRHENYEIMQGWNTEVE